MVTVSASEVQKNFGEWHDKAHDGPVEISRQGQTTAFLVSAETFREMWASFRRAVPVEALSDDDIALIGSAEAKTDDPFNLDDIPEIDDVAPPMVPR